MNAGFVFYQADWEVIKYVMKDGLIKLAEPCAGEQ
jgi:hypothetical protein